ncbi:MAG: hypothetical protein CL610_09810 [Anaerolineaceae bacterium]|nr:hypothetical protein [Anaerolineaceae bacterium]
MKARIIVVFLLLLSPNLILAQETNQRPELPGSIAYVGADFNIYRLDLDTYEHTQLTDDAGETRRYQWPTWSTDGRLAYFSQYVEDGNLRGDVHISADGSEPGSVFYSGPELFNYAYWAPGNCDASEQCRDLAVLFSSASRGMFVELVRDGMEAETNVTAGLGGPPFYYSWSPDGARMIWQRNNQRFDIYDANQDRVIETLEQVPGFILSPAWSPVDDRLLLGVSSEANTTDLMVIGDDETHSIADGFSGLVSYNWSPDGNLIAYREQTEQGFGILHVVDAFTGDDISRSPTNGVIAFFWSPDSRQIAYLTLAAAPGSFDVHSNQHLAAQGQQPVGIAWSVLDVSTAEVKQFGAFIPTQETVYLIQYADQFAQSHRIWSPDGTHLLYSEFTPGGPVVNLLDTSQVGSVPFSIADGVIGIWSFE